MLSLPIQEQFRKFISPYFKAFLVDLGYQGDFDMERITVWADTDMYKWKEDEYIWAQKREKTPSVYQVFFDGKQVCYLGEQQTKEKTLSDFWKGFLRLYELDDDNQNKIYINKDVYVEKEKQRKEKEKQVSDAVIKAIKDKPVTNQTQAEAKEIALNVAKETSINAK